MDGPHKHQVSLRGASAKEITRDALLEKVTQEREFRNYIRRATAASLFIQRVWRRNTSMKKVAAQIREEWQEMLNCQPVPAGRAWISNNLLRPFLFFVTTLATRGRKFENKDVDCMQICFRILLESINSSDPQRNFCPLALTNIEERRTWTYQAKKLISLCVLILSECDYSYQEGHQSVSLTSMAMRFVVSLTDVKGWKALNDVTLQDADRAVKDLVGYMCSEKSQLYLSIRRYVSRLDVHFSSQTKTVGHADDKFLITVSAITLALRPFNIGNMKTTEDGFLDIQFAAEQYCVLLLTIPWFIQRLPAVLLPVIKHKSVMSPCFSQILVRLVGKHANKIPKVTWCMISLNRYNIINIWQIIICAHRHMKLSFLIVPYFTLAFTLILWHLMKLGNQNLSTHMATDKSYYLWPTCFLELCLSTLLYSF